MKIYKIGHKDFVFILLLLCLSLLCGCSKPTFPQAKAKQERGEYFDAANLYRKIYARTPSKERKKRGEAAFEMAECYRKINYTSRALGGYQNALRYKVKDSIASLRIAQMLHLQGKYQPSIQYYEEFLQRYPHCLEAQQGLEWATWAQECKDSPSPYEVKRASLFNSHRSDFAPLLVGEQFENLYYTSSNEKFKERPSISSVTGMKDFDLFFSKKNEKGQWMKPEPIEGEVNTNGDEGIVSFSSDGQRMYFSYAKDEEEGYGKALLALSRKEGDKWGKPTLLYPWDDSTVMASHPAVSPDGQYLYFVSDKLGGYGGKDLWRAPLMEEGSLGEPENLGAEINTEKDEMFPYVRSNGTLYYSSNGKKGMGGLDIFRAIPMVEEGEWKVENMGYPINSSGDDFGITFEGEEEKGFFSSNRNDGKGWDHIYSFEYSKAKVWVEGFVVDREDYILPQATIRVVGNDGTILKTHPKVDGTFSIALDFGKDYLMQATLKGYLNDRHQISTLSEIKDTSYIHDFVLTPFSQSVSIDNVFYEFGKATLLPSSYAALDKIVEMMQQFPKITIELAAHTDRKGSKEFNEKLSLLRAEAVMRYIEGKGISSKRLQAKGYGSSVPKKITKRMASMYPKFLREDDLLTPQFIEKLPPKQQEIADQLNRRTEFTVLSEE